MSDEDFAEDDSDRDYYSGPYCHGYQDPSDCAETCECGHECHEHKEDLDSPEIERTCRHEGCACVAFVSAPLPKGPTW